LRFTVDSFVPVRKAARRDASVQTEDGVTDRSYAGLVKQSMMVPKAFGRTGVHMMMVLPAVTYVRLVNLRRDLERD